MTPREKPEITRSELVVGVGIVSLILAQHLDRGGVILEGSCAEELKCRLEALSGESTGTGVVKVLKASIEWLKADEKEDGEATPPKSALSESEAVQQAPSPQLCKRVSQ